MKFGSNMVFNQNTLFLKAPPLFSKHDIGFISFDLNLNPILVLFTIESLFWRREISIFNFSIYFEELDLSWSSFSTCFWFKISIVWFNIMFSWSLIIFEWWSYSNWILRSWIFCSREMWLPSNFLQYPRRPLFPWHRNQHSPIIVLKLGWELDIGSIG